MERQITFRFVDTTRSTRTFRFKTLQGARKRARKLVGNAKLDPDGYAVGRLTGCCLFFQGVTFEELFA